MSEKEIQIFLEDKIDYINSSIDLNENISSLDILKIRVLLKDLSEINQIINKIVDNLIFNNEINEEYVNKLKNYLDGLEELL